MLNVKPGVLFATISPGGARIIAALDAASRIYNPLTITSGTDGLHSGQDDPHHLGQAYDVRSHDFDAATKQQVLLRVLYELSDGDLTDADGGYVTTHFFGWLEQAGTTDEHFHFQLRHGAALTE